MFDRPLGHCRRPPAVLVLGAILSVTSLVAAPAHGFGLSGAQFVDGLGKVGDALKAEEDAKRHDRSATAQFVDDNVGKIADKAADGIELGSIKASGKTWDALMKSGSKVGELAKKAAKRWGPAVSKGLRLAGPAGLVVNTAETGFTVGGAIGENVVVPLIDRYFDGKSRVLEEQIRRDMMEIRKRGEFRRRLDEDIAYYESEARAMDDEERRLYGPSGGSTASDPWADNEGGAERDDTDPVTSNGPDSGRQDDVIRHREESGREQWDDDTGDTSSQPDHGTPGCEDDWGGCPGDEYWNEELQEKARQLDPWAAYREEQRRKMAGTENRGDASAQDCEDGWADCSETGWAQDGTSDDLSDIGGSREEAGPEEFEQSSEGSYSMSLARLLDKSAESPDGGSASSDGNYQAALEGLEEEGRRQREEAERQRERAEEERRQREKAERQQEGSSSQQTNLAPSQSGDTRQQEPETLSSNCADNPPACTRAVRAAELQNAPLEMAIQTNSSPSVLKSLLAQVIQNGIVAGRACYAAEKRPHCKKGYLDSIRELEKSLMSTLADQSSSGTGECRRSADWLPCLQK